MKFDRQEAVVLCISPGIGRRWDVAEKGFDQPIASFDEKEDAYAFAKNLTWNKRDATVLVEDKDGFSALPLHGQGEASSNHCRGAA